MLEVDDPSVGDPGPDGVQARVDAELVRRGLVRSRALAARAIDEGRVTVDGRAVRKAAARVAVDNVLEVAGEDRYVARSAHKLIAALDAFDIDATGRLALDVGASTGGFTQVLLERGVREVVALDVGHGQLVPALRDDPRVRALERVNARELDPALFARLTGTDERPDLVVVDVSFISLRTVLPALRATAAPAADLVVLVKPQFEVGRGKAPHGIVTDPAARKAAVEGVLDAAEEVGLLCAGVIPSPVLGISGNQEYLAWLRPDC